MENFYVYSHTFLNEKNPFYIGIGSSKKHCRAFSIKNRNKIWNRVVNKYGEYKVDILHDGIVYNSALLAAKDLGISDKHIGSVCRGNRPHTCNYKFKHILE